MSSPSSSFMFTYYPAPTPGPASSPPTGSTDGLSFSALPGNGGVSDHSLGDHANMRNALSHLSILFIVCGVVLFWMIAFVFILCSVFWFRSGTDRRSSGLNAQRKIQAS
ncbi:hypothetical protein I316_07765 [Kwoniella heveanensis BCC8398]|uniref:Uncharacterized protein n=1 Tax=Kwoniella heveanensis BCC8398 TaxID=1296120 RepID=A0A1B9GHL8_9TREE|nr:hypothetical protein I316_07765 [Kwoniella heveanensis BCC8398]